jgi:hypothetical protein
MKQFKVIKYNCGPPQEVRSYPCYLCKIEYKQVYWWFIVGCGWFHSEECANMFILREMGE